MHLYRLGELTLYSLTDIPLSVFLLTESTVVTLTCLLCSSRCITMSLSSYVVTVGGSVMRELASNNSGLGGAAVPSS